MKYAVIRNGAVFTVTETNDADLAEREGWVPCDDSVSVGDIWDGATFSTPEPAADPLQVQAATVAAIQDLLDSTAREHGYDDLRSAISYVGSSIPKWDAEGIRAKAWRDECWWMAYEIQEAVKAGTLPLPEVGEVLAQLPPANWPV